MSVHRRVRHSERVRSRFIPTEPLEQARAEQWSHRLDDACACAPGDPRQWTMEKRIEALIG